jgi:hypothetical protein
MGQAYLKTEDDAPPGARVSLHDVAVGRRHRLSSFADTVRFDLTGRLAF